MAVIVLPFVAELQFETAKKFKEGYRWERAGEKYQSALHLNPFNASYFAGAGDFMLQQSAYRQGEDEISGLKRAEKLYERACWLNPRYAGNWYLLGKVRMELNEIDEVIDNFRESIERDPYNFRNNYLIGHNLLTAWGSLNEKEKEFTLDRLKYVLQLRPGYGGRYVYPAIMYYAKDFSIAQEVTPETLTGYKGLYSFIVKNNLWQFRKQVAGQMDFYREKEEPGEFAKDKEERMRLLRSLRSPAMTGELKGWVGKSANGKSTYKNGNMYWTGTVDRVVEMPQGRAKINITAKGSQADQVFPYMIVELDGAEIGETFVDSPEWKEYSFKADTEGGLKILSITFVNDGGNREKNEDRNLYIGKAKIVNDNEK